MSNPFVKNFNELLENIKSDIDNNETNYLYIASDKSESIFQELLVQTLEREIDNVKVKFLAIRNVKLKEQHKSQGLFSNFIKKLESLNIDIMFHDVINEKLIPFLEKMSYSRFEEEKYDCNLISYYKTKIKD